MCVYLSSVLSVIIKERDCAKLAFKGDVTKKFSLFDSELLVSLGSAPSLPLSQFRCLYFVLYLH